MTDLITTPETFWNSLREQLLEVIPADTFRVWFDNMRIGRLDDDGCELIAPNEFSAIWIRDNYLDVIRQEADRLVGRPYTVDLLGELAEEDIENKDHNDRLKSSKLNNTTFIQYVLGFLKTSFLFSIFLNLVFGGPRGGAAPT